LYVRAGTAAAVPWDAVAATGLAAGEATGLAAGLATGEAAGLSAAAGLVEVSGAFEAGEVGVGDDGAQAVSSISVAIAMTRQRID
jgi:hypothetical protein